MSDVNLINYESREDWLAARNLGIGASESAALFGLSPWLSPFALWADKTGMAPRENSTAEHLRWGLLLEKPIAEAYAMDSKRTVWEPPSPWCVAVDRELECLRATPDRWIVEADGKDGRGVLEIKNVDGSKSSLWDEMPPLHVQIQVQHQLAVTGFRWGTIAALIGGNRLRTWDIDRNDDMIAELRIRVAEFWRMVQSKTAPEADGSEATAKALKALYPLDNGEAVVLPPESIEWYAAFEKAKADEKLAKEEKIAAENRIKTAIGPATFGVLPSGQRLTLRTTSVEGRTQVVEPYTFRTIRLEKETKTKPRKGSKA
jgi:putative phage-type endonuclease